MYVILASVLTKNILEPWDSIPILESVLSIKLFYFKSKRHDQLALTLIVKN